MIYEAPAERVYRMLVDPTFQSRRAQAGQPEHAEATVVPGPGDGATITVNRRMAVDLPGFIAKLAGGKVTLNEVQVWRDSGGSTEPVRDGTIRATMAGQPGGVVGTLRIDEAGGSTTVSVDAEISVKVPLVGGRIERFVADMLDRLLAYEESVGREWLAAAEQT
jgi:uncharacterized protein YndB with AHSA1/START domain